MAIISISRQPASLGDEIAFEAAKLLGYKFVCRSDIEKKILSLGFPPAELKKFDERKPGFFASLTRNRDQYLDHLKTAIYETAQEGNCVIVGRGAGIIMEGIANHLGIRFICETQKRIQFVQNTLQVDEKTARKYLKENDAKQYGFYKSFYETDLSKSAPFQMVLNTGFVTLEQAAEIIASSVKVFDTKEANKKGEKRLDELLVAQRLVNMLLLDFDISIHFLRAEINDKVISLYGIADSSATVDRALTICRLEIPDYEVKSYVKVVQDLRGK